MAETTNIGWCDATVNFWHGCKKVSEGCKYCYMFRDKERWKQDGSVVKKSKKSTITTTMNGLLLQDMRREKEGITEPLKIFTCSWSDFFIEQADEWRDDAWQIIRSFPQFIWIILTKRPERMEFCLPKDWGEGWPNVWLGVSAENQERANERIPILLKTPAKIRCVSCEPLLGPIDLNDLDTNDVYGSSVEALKGLEYHYGAGQDFGPALDWIIVGGESGNSTGKWLYRPCNIEWIRDIVKASREAGVAVFVKQLGTDLSKFLGLDKRHGDDVNEFPRDLQIQEFPNKT